jgi:hypothetical protein
MRHSRDGAIAPKGRTSRRKAGIQKEKVDRMLSKKDFSFSLVFRWFSKMDSRLRGNDENPPYQGGRGNGSGSLLPSRLAAVSSFSIPLKGRIAPSQFPPDKGGAGGGLASL